MKTLSAKILTIFAVCFATPVVSAQVQTPGVTKNEILLGQTATLSGANSAKVAETIKGYQLFFNQLNAAGGVNGRKVRVIAYDDKYDPETALANVTRLIKKDEVFAIFKLYGTATMRAVLPLIEKEDVPVLAPSSGALFVKQPVNRNIFSFKPGAAEEADAIIRHIVDELKIKEIGVLYQDDAFGTDGKNSTVRLLKERNLAPVAIGSYSRKNQNLEAAVEELRRGKARVIILWSNDEATQAFIRKAKEKSFEPVYFGTATLATTVVAEFVSALGVKEFFVTAVSPLPDPASELGRQYQSAVSGGSIKPTDSVFEGYFDAAVLTEALKRAGPNLTRQALRETFESKMNDVTINGVHPQFSPASHLGFTKVRLLKVNAKNFTPVATGR